MLSQYNSIAPGHQPQAHSQGTKSKHSMGGGVMRVLTVWFSLADCFLQNLSTGHGSLPESVLPPELRMVSLLCQQWFRLSTWQKPQSPPCALTPMAMRLLSPHTLPAPHPPTTTPGSCSERALSYPCGDL